LPPHDVSLVTATDNCTAGVTITWVSDLISNQTCANRYTITRTYKGTDGCGNEGTCSQTIIVNDLTPPELTCPEPVTVSCASEVGQPNPALVLATDNCAGTVTVTWVGDQISNQTCANRYTITRTYKGTDACGNEGFCTQTITVNDMTAPVITCPPPITINCQQSPLPEVTGMATAIDNCGPQVSVTYTDVIVPGNCPGNYTINRTWTATDLCENSVTCLQVITVTDTQAPTWITTPGALNASLDCDDANGLDAALLLVPTATDNCSNTIITVPTMVTTQGPCAGNYVIVRTWSVSDACGNVQPSLYTQTITVADTDPPTWVTGEGDLDRTLSCGDESGLEEALSLAPEAEDNCSTFEIEQIGDETIPGNCTGNYVRVRTWSVIDDCRNEGSLFTQTITVSDNIPPVIENVPEDLLVSCSGQVPASAPIPVTVTDNCGGQITVTVADVISNWQCINRYTLTRTWTATDACGNSSNASQVITVYEVGGPIITKVPADETYSCALMVPATNSLSVTVTDDCGGEPTVTVNEVISDWICANHYTITRTWVATDACGNSSNASQTVLVFDNIAPEISCPGPLTIACGGAVPDPDITQITAFDNCGVPTVTWVSDVTSGQNPMVITRTYMATDVCGNTATCTQLITVNTANVAAEIIQPEQYPFCGMINNILSSTVTNGIPTNYNWNISSLNGDWTILSGASTGTVYYNAGLGSAVFSLTVTDNNGCTSTTELPMDCVPAGEYCSMTQGFYGNPSGTYCNGMTTLALLNDVLLTTPLTIGWQNNTMTVSTGEGQCILNLMPGSGPAKRITGVNTCASHPGIQTRANNGKIYNILLAQTLTYGLNLRLSPLLVTLPMGTSWLTTAESTGCGQGLPDSKSVGNTWEYHTISSAVWTKLTTDYGATPDAWDLYDLANRAVGNDPSVATSLLTPISDAVAMMNESFDECMWGTFDGGYIGPTSPFGGGSDEPALVDETHYIGLSISPNPFENTTEIRFMTTWDTKVKVEIYNVLGIVVETPFYGTVNADKWNSVFFTADPSMPASTYICVIRTDQGTEMRRMILIR